MQCVKGEEGEGRGEGQRACAFRNRKEIMRVSSDDVRKVCDDKKEFPEQTRG